MPHPIRIAMVAGETSGDLLASHLILALRKRLPEAQFYGIGGPRMQAAGFDALYPCEKLAVRGYAEVLKHYWEIAGIRRALTRRLLHDRPHAFIGVDAPDFNLGLERRLKSRGIPAIHYVSPSIWAWRGGRIESIARSVSHMLVLFPFEPALYEKQGIPVTYVGHPLADLFPLAVDRAAARECLNLPGDQLVFALLPGSRQSEVEYMGELFVETARLLHERYPRAHFLVPLATRETRQMFETAVHRRNARDLPLTLLFGHSHDAMAAADIVLVASGTATLEAALLKRPMVITYRMSPWTYRIMWPRRYLPYVGLPNILAGRFVVPELLQDEATPSNLAQALANLAEDKETCARMEQLFTSMHEQLRQNTAERAAAAIVPYLTGEARWKPAPQTA
ncbi:MAG: lipid-A-disaccharide synthase [Pseudomonadota bacterium]|jgi:lipid-A-disaccharide synthase